MPSPHSFDLITAGEIQLGVQILQKTFTNVPLRYKRVDIQEPIKKEVVPYIEAERLSKASSSKAISPSIALFHRLDDGSFDKALFNGDRRTIIYAKQLPKHVPGPVDLDEREEIEKLCLEHSAVKEEIKKMKLPSGVTVCAENGFPCRFSPAFHGVFRKLIRIDYLPTGLDHTVVETQPWKPLKTVQYAYALLDKSIRQDLKPYIVQQPQGASSSTEENLVSWQKWKFRVGFNSCEGLVIHNVTYDGRNTFYRLSLSGMTVSYGDPPAPYQRKQAFDMGDVGFGTTADQLPLGCDCLGVIKYFGAHTVDSADQGWQRQTTSNCGFADRPRHQGFKNTVFYEDNIPLPASKENPYGVGYVAEKSVLKTSGSAETSVYADVFDRIN
ncbi:hypothetical protein PENFLA_c020G00182 [Penicillium flavigenum]|uniref:Amine oxidase n=1 Tax=Penicillium flavigenum TaxID=254877 RepID=A0A1V6SYH6_9EURO|nr:hypothetical protein PENFLA_c020G00182 [Penicillium flavigenum]